jgi:hypothetical protein
MSGCMELTKEMLVSPRRLIVSTGGLDFSGAKGIADKEALKINPDAMLLAWFDRRTGGFSPKVEWGGLKKPGWLVYAESRGGRIVITINEEEYVFVYLGWYPEQTLFPSAWNFEAS